jgi:hypothetical protein
MSHTPPHIGRARRHVDPRCRSKAKHRPTPLQALRQGASTYAHQIPCPLRSDTRPSTPPKAQCHLRWGLPAVWRFQRAIEQEQYAWLHPASCLAGTCDSSLECLLKIHDRRKTMPASNRWTHTRLQVAPPLPGSADESPQPAPLSRSYRQSITERRRMTGVFLGRSHSTGVRGPTQILLFCQPSLFVVCCP